MLLLGGVEARKSPEGCYGLKRRKVCEGAKHCGWDQTLVGKKCFFDCPTITKKGLCTKDKIGDYCFWSPVIKKCISLDTSAPTSTPISASTSTPAPTRAPNRAPTAPKRECAAIKKARVCKRESTCVWDDAEKSCSFYCSTLKSRPCRRADQCVWDVAEETCFFYCTTLERKPCRKADQCRWIKGDMICVGAL